MKKSGRKKYNVCDNKTGFCAAVAADSAEQAVEVYARRYRANRKYLKVV